MNPKLKGNPLVNEDGTVTPRPCLTVDLGDVYGVSRKTIHCWLKPIREQLGEKTSRVFTQNQVEIIFRFLGTPKLRDVKNFEMAD